MNDIPEEIRKMFPDQPIHKLDIDDSGELHVLASADPLSNDPHFENMPTEQVNKYLRDHGYDPERVGLTGKILSEALIENIALLARAEAAERELAELRERTQGVCRWRLTDDDHGWWTGDCGAEWIFEASDPNGNKMKFCPDCGRKLEQIEPEPEDDDE